LKYAHREKKILTKSPSSRVSTGVTFKQAKGDLLKKGWDPRKDSAGDSLYWLNGTSYEKLEDNSWSAIERGQAKL